jgi:hypothetical protein
MRTFLVDFKPPIREIIGGRQQGLVASSIGEFGMYLFEPPIVPDIPVLIATAEADAQIKSDIRAFGFCLVAGALGNGQDGTMFDPVSDARENFSLYENREIDFGGISVEAVQLIKGPDHGKISYDGPSHWEYAVVYMPDQGYVGNDHVEFLVDVHGTPVRVVYFIKVTKTDIERDTEGVTELCEGKFRWKISISPEDTDLANRYPTLALQVLLTGAQEALSGFADFSSAALGQTTGSKITLDTNAAGHGWFIDYTPYLNEEWLPTSNPYEWQAKPGSDAEGKMDMLSVLLHEYGHVLGLEHTADAHDFMSTTLQPGVRRLPSASELQQMANLVAQLKGEMGLTSTTPQQPDTPLPYTPLPASVGLAAFLASRQRRDTEVLQTSANGVTRHEIAANPKLTDADFKNGGSAWSTLGNVIFADGAATLKETASTQTRLNQVFVLGENDRTLTFTLSGIALDDVDNAPDDAFEVALIDANTGLSLLGSTGLTRNDAILNLQANGAEYRAAGVTTTRNDDGSLTVQVDLSGIAAGTVVNLSYDLIGFGRGAQAASSQVRVNALRLGAADPGTNPGTDPGTNPGTDPGTNPGTDPGINPGNPTDPANPDISWPDTPWNGGETGSNGTNFGNGVDNGSNTGNNADASNSWSGHDNGKNNDSSPWGGDSDFWNTDGFGSEPWHMDAPSAGIKPDADARPVQANEQIKQTDNHAPTASSLRVKLDRNTQVTLDLLENASDPDGDTLTVRIVTSPRHGRLVANPDDGTYTYIPDEDYIGEDSFTYKVNDGKLDSNIATVTLVVALAEDGIPEQTGVEESGDERPDKSATITIQSKLAYSSPIPQNEPYILLGRRKGETEAETKEIPKVDWNGVLPAFIITAPLWAAPLLPVKKGKKDDEELDSKRLAEITGLWFPMDQEGDR